MEASGVAGPAGGSAGTPQVVDSISSSSDITTLLAHGTGGAAPTIDLALVRLKGTDLAPL